MTRIPRNMVGGPVVPIPPGAITAAEWNRQQARKAERQDYAAMLAKQCEGAKLASPQREYRFNKKRKWRFDLAWPWSSETMTDFSFAVEIEGGIWVGGRHNRGSGFLADMEKYNEAALDGWAVLRVTPAQVESGEALALVKRALG